MLERIEQSQMGAISAAAERCAEAISSGGLVHLFGTGHSRMALEEMFPRYGSYPGFHPIAELSMTFHTQVVGSNGRGRRCSSSGPRGWPSRSWPTSTSVRRTP